MKNNLNFLIIATPNSKKEWQKKIKSISKKAKFLFIEKDKKKIIKTVKKANVIIECNI